MSDLRTAAQNVVAAWNQYGTAKSLRGWMGILEDALQQPEQCSQCSSLEEQNIELQANLAVLEEVHNRQYRRLAEMLVEVHNLKHAVFGGKRG